MSGKLGGDQFAAQGHDPRAVLQRQSTGDARRGQLALGMPDHGGRAHAVLLPDGGQ